MKILIVEHDTTRQRQLRTILSSIGHKSGEIEAVPDSKAAISLLRKKKFDCAFVALGSRAFDGLELLKNIRSGGSSRNLPIVMYTGDVTRDAVISAHEGGANAFLAYPFSVSDVETSIQKALKEKSA